MMGHEDILIVSVALFNTLDLQLLKNLLSTPKVQQNSKEGVRKGIHAIQ
ncbi:MAG TPA: hypothetical protein PL059_13800 [Spirochaetota bacterium]|nr:hypothetical protein [Spirochaetota bacterium]HOM11249.1 hypothetical protein [Spirochaetota bacterium]HPP51047.1 hypothetical protein [Spirochaetota bacterium]